MIRLRRNSCITAFGHTAALDRGAVVAVDLLILPQGKHYNMARTAAGFGAAMLRRAVKSAPSGVTMFTRQRHSINYNM